MFYLSHDGGILGRSFDNFAKRSQISTLGAQVAFLAGAKLRRSCGYAWLKLRVTQNPGFPGYPECCFAAVN